MNNQEELHCSILSFFDSAQGDSCGTVFGWVQNNQPINLFSACCLHATERRDGIPDRLDLSQLELLARTAIYACDKLNPWSWHITTFGPEDLEWLRDHHLTSVLLPYMSEVPDCRVREDLAKSFDLTLQVASRLEESVGVPVDVSWCTRDFASLDVACLRQVSKSRTAATVRSLKRNPPKIFSQLTIPQQLLRVENEQILYLADTVIRGQKPGGDSLPTLQLLIEVHGGYIESGQLHRGPEGEFLPTAILPACARQHWTSWKANQPNMVTEAAVLAKKLVDRGY